MRIRSVEAGRAVVIAGLVLALCFAALLYSSPSWLRTLDFTAQDFMIRHLVAPPPNPDVVVVDIDRRSLARFGQWPWPRHLAARMLLNIAQSEPAAVGMDILFAEADRSSLLRVRDELLEIFGVDLDISGVPGELRDNDAILGQVADATHAVVGVMFRFEDDDWEYTTLPPPALTFARLDRPGAPQTLRLPEARSSVPVIHQLHAASGGAGFVNSLADPDGVIRRVPLLINYGNRVYPSLALSLAARAMGNKAVILESDPSGISSVNLGALQIPVDRAANMALRYSGPGGTYEHISAKDVILGDVPPESLRGKVVIIGSSAEGLMDRHASPHDPVFPGVEVHATAVGNLLGQHILRVIPWNGWQQLLAVILAVLLATWAVRGRTPLACLLILAAGSSVLLSGAVLLWQRSLIFFSPLYALDAMVLSFTLLALVRFWGNDRVMRRRDRQLASARATAIMGLASLAETRDNETGRHILRTQYYVRELARTMARMDMYPDEITEDVIDEMFKVAPLHDIGKVGVPDAILKKPGRLTDEEYDEMQRHTVYGHDALARAESLTDADDRSPFLVIARQITISHHEKWDGSGYPHGLAGEDIPLSGRIMAVADVYDALISRRCYKEPKSHEQAVEIIRQGSGSHFDPKAVEAFLAAESTFARIAAEHPDE